MITYGNHLWVYTNLIISTNLFTACVLGHILSIINYFLFKKSELTHQITKTGSEVYT